MSILSEWFEATEDWVDLEFDVAKAFWTFEDELDKLRAKFPDWQEQEEDNGNYPGEPPAGLYPYCEEHWELYEQKAKMAKELIFKTLESYEAIERELLSLITYKLGDLLGSEELWAKQHKEED